MFSVIFSVIFCKFSKCLCVFVVHGSTDKMRQKYDWGKIDDYVFQKMSLAKIS